MTCLYLFHKLIFILAFITFNAGISDNGWMTAQTFQEYMQKIFYPYLCEKGVEFPVVVFLDGHSSHFSFETIEFCTEKKIFIAALYPNSTHLTQPMDVAGFGPLKKNWREAVHNWKTRTHSATLTKDCFAGLLQQVINETVKPEHLQSGFRACGLFPFTPEGINYEKLIRNKSERVEQNDVEAAALEIEKTDFENAYKRIGEILGIEKENIFLKFYAADNARAWNLAVEDTTAYYIWREALERSRGRSAEVVQPSSDADLVTEEIIDWGEQGNYFEDISDIIDYDLFDHLGPIEVIDAEENHTVQVLENIVLVPALERSSTPITISHSETETIPMHVIESDSFEPIHNEAHVSTQPNASITDKAVQPGRLMRYSEGLNVPLEESVPKLDIPPAGPNKTIENDAEVTNNCPVDEIFLKCLKQQPTTSQANNNQQKFRVPKIKGKISIQFTSPYDSHYISCIDFSSGTSVVSSKWHRDYIQRHKNEHEKASMKRLDRKIKKEPVEKKRKRRSKYMPANTSDSNFDWSDEDDEDFVVREKKGKGGVKTAKRAQSVSEHLDSSFSSDSSFIQPSKKKKSNLTYSTDDN